MERDYQEIKELEKEILKVQQSTRTILPYFSSVHDKLRMKYGWYYKWHLSRINLLVHLGVFAIYLLVVGLVATSAFYHNDAKVILASSRQGWDTADEWSQWELSGVQDNSLPGSLALALKEPTNEAKTNIESLEQISAAEGASSENNEKKNEYVSVGTATYAFTPHKGEAVDWLSDELTVDKHDQNATVSFSVDNSTFDRNLASLSDSETLFIKITLETADASVTPSVESLYVNYSRRPSAPKLVAPQNNAELKAGKIEFKAEGYEDQDNDRHLASEWQYTRTQGDYTAPYTYRVTEGDLLSFQAEKELEPGTYYWRVRFQDSAGSWSDYSAEYSFSCKDSTKRIVKDPKKKLDLSQSPGYFVENKGQVNNPEVKYYNPIGAVTYFFTDNALVTNYIEKETEAQRESGRYTQSDPKSKKQEEKKEAKALSLKLSFLDAKTSSPLAAEDGGASVNYIHGDGSGQPENRTYQKIIYSSLYNGIDLTYSSRGSKLKSEFKVSAHSDPNQIKLRYDGAESLGTDEAGNLVVSTELGNVVEDKPYSYQEIDGKRQKVDVTYIIYDNATYGYEIGNYDPGYLLTIDPSLSFIAKVGGGSNEYIQTGAKQIAVDASGNTYITGYTQSSDFPTVSGLYTTLSGTDDTYIAKFNSTGTSLLYATYIGGSSWDRPNGIFLDGSNNIYVYGETGSNNFPNAGSSYRATLGDYDTHYVFAFKLNAAGNQLIYSSLIRAVPTINITPVGALDSQGRMNIADVDYNSTDGYSWFFVSRLSSDGTALDYINNFASFENPMHTSSWQFYDRGAIDSNDQFYVTGITDNPNYPTTPGSYGDTFSGLNYSCFLTRFSLTGTIDYSTFFLQDVGNYSNNTALTIKGTSIYIGGSVTVDHPLPTTPGVIVPTSPYQSVTPQGHLAKFDIGSNSYTFFTYWWERVNDIAIDSNDNIYIVAMGSSREASAITANAFQTTLNAGGEAYFAKLNPTATTVLYGTYMGGASNDDAQYVVTDTNDNVYIYGATPYQTTGQMRSSPGSYDSGYLGIGGMLYVAKFIQADFNAPTVVTGAASAITKTTATLNGTITDTGGVNIPVTRGFKCSLPVDSLCVADTWTAAMAGTTLDPGAITANISSLTAGTIYCVRAYGTNNMGTTYGDWQTFTTADPTVSYTLSTTSISENGGTSTVTATLTNVSGKDVTLNFTLSGTAVEGTDFSRSPSAITVTAGLLSSTMTITGIDNTKYEPMRSVILTAGTITNATLTGTNPQTINITDNDPQPTVTMSVDKATLKEGSDTATFTVTQSAISGYTTSITLLLNGTATNTSDYTASTTSVSIPAGSTTTTMTVTALADTVNDASETVIPTLWTASNATIGSPGSATVTIQNITVTLSASSGNGSENSTPATMTVNLNTSSNVTITVHYATSNGTATAGVDYTATSGDLTFNPGETSKDVSVPISNDTMYELNETFTLTLSAPTNAALITPTSYTYTINNDDPLPSVTLSSDHASISENGGVAVLTATLSNTSYTTVTIGLGFTGTVTYPGDYTRSGTSISITTGNLSGSVTVTGVNDATVESSETIIVDITSVTNGTESGTQQQTVTVVDDDTAPTVTFSTNTNTIAEAGGVATLTGTLSGTWASSVTLNLTYTGTATSSSDYTASGSSITITPGNLSSSITLTAVQDALDEADETAVVRVASVTGATLSGLDQQTITITDDDSAPTVGFNAISSGFVEPVGQGSVIVSLSSASGQSVSVHYESANGTAIAGTDYTNLSGDLAFNTGETSKQINLVILNDAIWEDSETLTLTLSSPVNATLGSANHTVTIQDDDPVPTVQFEKASASGVEGSVVEGAIILSNMSSATITVGYSSLDGSATAGKDYQAISGTLTFLPGEVAKTVTTTTVDDAIYSGNRNFSLLLSSPSSATLGSRSVFGYMITENDEPPVVPTPTPSVSPTVTPTPTPSPSASPTPTPSPTSSPTIVPNVNGYKVVSLTATREILTQKFSSLKATIVLDREVDNELVVPLSLLGSAQLALHYDLSASAFTVKQGTKSAEIEIRGLQPAFDGQDRTIVLDVAKLPNLDTNGVSPLTIKLSHEDDTITILDKPLPKIDTVTKVVPPPIKNGLSVVSDSVDRGLSKVGISKENSAAAVATTSAVVAAATIPLASATNALTLYSLPELLRSLWYSIFFLAGLKRKRKPWGRVIEDGTDIGIPIARVTLLSVDPNGIEKPVESVYSNKDGYFGFIARPGEYRIMVSKSGYLIAPNYDRNKIIKIHDYNEGVIMEDIPMFMPNTSLISKHRLLVFLTSLERGFIRLSFIILAVGTVVSINKLIQLGSVKSLLVVFALILLWVVNFKKLIKASPWGDVIEYDDAKPIPLTLVRIIDENQGKLVRTVVSDEKGKFSALLDKGQYVINAAKIGYNLPSPLHFDAKKRLTALSQRIKLVKNSGPSSPFEIQGHGDAKETGADGRRFSVASQLNVPFN